MPREPMTLMVQGSNVSALTGRTGTLRRGQGGVTGGWPMVLDTEHGRLRRLRLREVARLQGVSDPPVSVTDTNAVACYQAIANAFAVHPVRWIGLRMSAQEAT